MRFIYKPWRLYILTILPFSLVTVVGCTELHSSRQTQECTELFEHIQADWIFDSEKKVYRFDLSETEFVVWKQLYLKKQCLIGLSRKSIEKLFGSPSESLPDEFRYYINENCKGKSGVATNGCQYLQISFDGEDRMKGFDMPRTQYIDN